MDVMPEKLDPEKRLVQAVIRLGTLAQLASGIEAPASDDDRRALKELEVALRNLVNDTNRFCASDALVFSPETFWLISEYERILPLLLAFIKPASGGGPVQ